MMKAFAAAALSVALTPAAASAPAPPATVPNSATGPSWLMIQTAKGYRFDGRTLTLLGINPDTLMFSDRPRRLVHHTTTAAFLKGWNKGKDSFQSDPPNAAITSLFGRQMKEMTVELTNPRLRGTTLAYDARILNGRLPSSGGATTLLIDDDGNQCAANELDLGPAGCIPNPGYMVPIDCPPPGITVPNGNTFVCIYLPF